MIYGQFAFFDPALQRCRSRALGVLAARWEVIYMKADIYNREVKK
jgi:hypothetical protein